MTYKMFIDIIFFKGNRINGMQFALNKVVDRFYAVIDIAIAVVIVDFKAEYHAPAALETSCEEVIFQQVTELIARVLYSEHAAAVYLIY